jgi:hypothetical protein
VYSTTPWTFSGGSTSANKVVAGDVHLNAVSSSGDGGPGGAAGVDNGGHSGSAGQPGQPPHGSEQYVAGFTSYPDFSIAPNSSKLHVDLAAFTPGGEKLNGQVASGDVVVVRLTVSNDGDTDLHNLQLAGGAPLVIDPRGTGTLTLLLGPTPSFDASTLPAHTAREYIYALTASVSGRAAAETKVSVDDAGLGHLEAARSLRLSAPSAVTPTS